MPNISAAFLLLLLLSISAAAQSAPEGEPSLDSDNGFMEYILGEGPSTMPPLTSIGRYQKMDRYRPLSDSLYFGEIGLKQIRLFFFKGQLHTLIVKTGGEADTEALLNYFRKRYGEGKQVDAMGTQFDWYGEALQLQFQRNLITSDGQFSFVSIPVHKKYEAYIYKRKYGDR